MLSSPGLIRKALKDLPEGLDATYDRMLQSINPKLQKRVTGLLNWLSFSLRPLRLHELAEAFILDHERSVPFDENERLFRPEDVLRYLPGLVKTVPIRIKHYNNDWNGVDIEIRLAHFSIKEYLVSHRILESPARNFSINEIDAHLYISESCLAYHIHISKTELATNESVKRFALWEYAALQWINHLEKVARDSWTTSIITQAMQVLRPRGQSLLNMIRMEDPDNKNQNWEKSDDLASPLYYASSFDALQLTHLLLKAGADINEHSPTSKFENPLQAASCWGGESIVRLLWIKVLR
jgi:hypothetical protein